VLPEHGLTTNADFLEGCTGVGYLTKDDHSGADTIRVATTTIDHQMELQKLSRMDFIKIDVEGAEIDVLRGGERSILRHRPIIAIEYNELALQRAGASILELDELLDGYGYDRFVFENSLKRYRPEHWEQYPVENRVYNVYCLPRESTR
jgi:hypothetical protein